MCVFGSHAFLFGNFHPLGYLYDVSQYTLFGEHQLLSKKSLCTFLSPNTYGRYLSTSVVICKNSEVVHPACHERRLVKTRKQFSGKCDVVLVLTDIDKRK